MTRDELVVEKNNLLIDLEANRGRMTPEEIRESAVRVGNLEARIADTYLDSGDPKKAAVNLVSQASLYLTAGLIRESVASYRRAAEADPKLATWVESQIAAVEN